MTAPDFFSAIRISLAASSSTRDATSAFYVAQARVAYEAAADELRIIERVLVAREGELVRLGVSK